MTGVLADACICAGLEEDDIMADGGDMVDAKEERRRVRRVQSHYVYGCDASVFASSLREYVERVKSSNRGGEHIQHTTLCISYCLFSVHRRKSNSRGDRLRPWYVYVYMFVYR